MTLLDRTKALAYDFLQNSAGMFKIHELVEVERA
jgi:hypothetical protein